MLIPEKYKRLLNNLNIRSKDLQLGETLETWIKGCVQFFQGHKAHGELILTGSRDYRSIESETPEIFNGKGDNTHKIRLEEYKESIMLTSHPHQEVGQKVIVHFTHNNSVNKECEVGFFIYTDNPTPLTKGELEVWIQDENNKISLPMVTVEDYVPLYGMYFVRGTIKNNPGNINKLVFVRKTSKPFQIWFNTFLCFPEQALQSLPHNSDMEYQINSLVVENNKLKLEDISLNSIAPAIMLLPSHILYIRSFEHEIILTSLKSIN